MLWDEMAEEVDAIRSNLSICMHAAAVTFLLDFHGDVSPLERVGKLASERKVFAVFALRFVVRVIMSVNGILASRGKPRRVDSRVDGSTK